MNNKNIKLICFDVNKTLIRENSWLDLNLAMGMTDEEDKVLFNLVDEGIIDTEEWLNIAKNIYRKRGNPTLENIEKVVFNYQYNEGATAVVRYLQEKGYEIAIISGSFDILVSRLTQELNVQL